MLSLAFALLFTLVSSIFLTFGLVFGFGRFGLMGFCFSMHRMIFYDVQIKLPVLQINLRNFDGQEIAKTESVPLSEPADHLPASFKTILVVGKCRDRNESIDG